MLRGDMLYDKADSEVSYFLNEVAERGIIVIYPDEEVLPPGLDTNLNTATVPTGTSGVPIGILMEDVKDKDLTDCPLKASRRETNVGYKVEIIRRGWFLTNMVNSGDTPSPGDPAHFMAGGLFTTSTTSARVGTFESALGPDGYVRVRVNL